MFAKPDKYVDAFDKKIAPTMAIERYKRQFVQAMEGVEKARAKLESMLEKNQAWPGDEELEAELDQRVAMISNGNAMIDKGMKLLEEFANKSKSFDEKMVKRRTTIKDAVTKAFPRLEAKLGEIEVRNQTELGRINLENERLSEENGQLRAVAGKSLGAAEVSAQLQEFLEGRLNAPVIDPAASAELEKAILKLTLEKSQLEDKIKNLESHHQQILELKNKRIEDYSAEKTKLDKQISSATKEAGKSTAALEKLNGELTSKNSKIEKLEAELTKQTELVKKESDRVNKLQTAFDVALAEKQNKINELEAPRTANPVDVAKQREAFMDYQQLKHDKVKLTRKCERLDEELETLKEERASLKREIDRLTPMENEVGSLRQETASLEQQRGTLQTRVDDLIPIANQVGGLQQEVERLKVFEIQATNLAGEKWILQTEVGRLKPFESQAVDLAGDKETLQTEVERLKPFESQAMDLAADKGNLQTEVERLKPFESQATNLAADKQKLQAEVARLTSFENTAATLQVEVSRLTPFEKKVATLEAEKKKLEESIETSNSAWRSLNNIFGHALIKEEKLKNEVKRLEPFEDDVKRLTEENSHLQTKNQKLEQDVLETNSRLNTQYQQQLDSYVSQKDEQCKKDVEKVQGEYNQCFTNYSRWKDYAGRLKEEKKGLEDENGQLKEQQETSKNKITELQSQNGDLVSKVSELQNVQQDLVRMKNDLAEIKQNEKLFNDGRIEVVGLKNQVRQLKEDKQKMVDRADYDRLAKSYESCAGTLAAEKEKVKKAGVTITNLTNSQRIDKENLQGQIAALKKDAVDPAVYNRLKAEKDRMVETAEYDRVRRELAQLRLEKEKMVQTTEYDRVRQELAQLRLEKEKMIDTTLYNELKDELEKVRSEKDSMADSAVYNQLKVELEQVRSEKENMVDSAVYNRLRDEHALCSRAPQTPQIPRESISRSSSTSSNIRGASPSPGSYASPYARQPETPTGSMTRQLSAASIGSSRSPSIGPSDRRPSLPNVPLAFGTVAVQQSPSGPSAFGTSIVQQRLNPPPAFGTTILQQSYNAPPPFGTVTNPPQQPAGQFGGPPAFGNMANNPQPNQFGGPLRGYNFLISGRLGEGQLTQNVAAELFAKMEAQISAWNSQIGKPSWSVPSSSSAARCVDTRRAGLSAAKAPPANDPHEAIACRRCIGKKQLCVLIGLRGPVIVPLPHSERSANLTLLDQGYYIKL